jgi:hypothetical protein
MPESQSGPSLVIDLFVEDRAHEAMVTALTRRISAEEDKRTVLRPRSARGGHGRVLSELQLYQSFILSQQALPDLVVVCIDANCKSINKAKQEIEARIRTEIRDRCVLACPNPHVERWYLSDPESFFQVVGSQPTLGKRKCERGRYKQELIRAIRAGGHQTTLRGVEFAQEIASRMDLFRAGKNETSLRLFVDSIRDKIRSL